MRAPLRALRKNPRHTRRKLIARRRVPSLVSSSAIDQRAASACADIDAGPAAAPHRAQRLVDVSCRTLDIVGSALLLLLLAPALAAIAIAIRFDSPGPAIFRQRRVGRGRRPFTVMKFRTMHQGVAHDPHREFVIGLIKGETPQLDTDSEETPGLYFKMIGDKRVTRVGRLLRRSSLDEVPQLWNVLRGEMSLVGPRPPIPYEVEHYPPHWFARFDVKPGVTGLWQVSGRSQVTLEEMVRLDVDYASRRSFRLNLWILVRTVPAVLGARGAW